MLREPLYPHVPKSRQPLFPHVPKGQQPATKLPAPRYEFFPESVKGRLPPIGATGEQKDPIVQVKFFTPWTNWTWYGIEFDGKDIFFGWVVGLEKEFGSFSLSELQSLKGPAGLKIERDIYFAPKPISQVMKEHGESLALPATIEFLASTEGDPIRKFCCRQCGECAPKELLEEGRFPDRIAWLRHHYKEKHPGVWGKGTIVTRLPQTEKGKYAWWLFDPETGEIMIKEGFPTTEKAKISAKAYAIQRARWMVVLPKRVVELKIYDRPPDIESPEIGIVFKGHILTPEGKIVEKGGQQYQPQVTIEGGDPVPPQYRDLIGFISEPLPGYSLLTLPAVEVEVGERKVDAVLKQLKAGVEGIQDSHQFRLFLTTMSKFHDYSIGNQILIMLQEPNATHVAGFVTWKELGRWVKRGGKGISILAPRFPPRPTCPKCGTKVPRGAGFCPKCGASVEEGEIEVAPAYFIVVSVFDISQTDGKPLPEFEVPVLTGAVNEELFSNLQALMEKRGVRVSFESRPRLDPAIKGQYSPVAGIWVRREEPRAQQLKSLAHEIAHYYSEGVFRIPRHDAETIAESAAYVVGAHYGFDTGVRSFPYVALWARDKKVLQANLDAIRKVATTMLEGLEK